MKNLRHLLAALALTSALTISAFAGDIHIGGSAPTPTPTPDCVQTNTCPDGPGSGGGGGNSTADDPTTEAALFIFVMAGLGLIRLIP